jgi:hypothetical protein
MSNKKPWDKPEREMTEDDWAALEQDAIARHGSWEAAVAHARGLANQGTPLGAPIPDVRPPPLTPEERKARVQMFNRSALQMEVIGFIPQCPNCHNWSADQAECSAGESPDTYFIGFDLCPKLDRK